MGYKITYQSTNLFPQPMSNCGSSCEEVTGSNIINVLKGGSWGLCSPGAKAFLLVTDNRRSWLDSPFCVITQHMKFEFGHNRQSKKISNAQELTMQLSQTFIFCYSTKQSFKQPNDKSHKKDLAPAPSSIFQFLYNLKINFLQIVLMGEGFPFLFCLWLLLLKKDFEGLIDVFPL